MKFKVQPADIDISQDDPFREDLLERKSSIEVLTKLTRSIAGPCVIGIDAAWGNGKTTYLRLLHAHLENNNIPVVGFNAWESDYYADPFAAIVTELTEKFQDFEDDCDTTLRKRFKTVKKRAKDVMRLRGSSIFGLLVKEIPAVGKPFGEFVEAFMTTCADQQMEAYKEAKASVESFRESLSDAAIATGSKDSILVIMIDELDRCRPTYAVELLEVVKHLFSASNVLFVLAVNRKELAHSIRALYGDRFDAEGYLVSVHKPTFLLNHANLGLA